MLIKFGEMTILAVGVPAPAYDIIPFKLPPLASVWLSSAFKGYTCALDQII